MSLFSSREWWQTSLGSDEEFDRGCICIANIDNAADGAVKVVTGSLQGVLRVHQPRQRGGHANDTLLEAELSSAILQLAAGNFLQQGSANLGLAVLHPRKLAVYALQAYSDGSCLQLTKAYEHALQQPAANMAYGTFGGPAAAAAAGSGGDHIVVQSYDGQLAFFEQEVAAFCAAPVPGFLLPGPIAYMPASDSLVTSTAGLELIALRYPALAAAAAAAAGTGSATGAGGERSHSHSSSGSDSRQDWHVVLGEAALDIRYGATAAGAPGMLVLAEHTFFVLDLRGHILLQHRLDHAPSCCWPILAAGGSGSSSETLPAGGSLLVATHSRALLVFQGDRLAWAAQLELVPVAVRVTTIGGVPGMIVALTDAGQLSVLYLGAEPPNHTTVATTPPRQLDYAAMEDERRDLLAQLQAAGGAAGLEAAAAAMHAAATAKQPPLLLKAQVPSSCDAPASTAAGGSSVSGAFGRGLGSGHVPAQTQQQKQRQLTVTLQLINTAAAALKGVALSVLLPAPLMSEDAQQQLPELPPRSAQQPRPLQVPLVLRAPLSDGGCGSSPQAAAGSDDGSGDGGGTMSLPTSSMARVVAAYEGPDGQACVSQLTIPLPMCLFCQVVPPVQTATFKITLSTNREAVQVADLFADMIAQASPAHADALSRTRAANALSFLFPGGAQVSILVSKNGGRYRLQASHFEAMWLVLQELEQRLGAHFAAAAKKPDACSVAAGAALAPPALVITVDNELPLQDLFDLFDRHFAARQSLAAVEAALEQQEVAFRSIQKRLLVRCREKNAAPLNQLDVLMEEAYAQITQLASRVEVAQRELVAAGQALSAGVQLLLLLARWRFGLGPEGAALLEGCLSPVVEQGPEVGWEELTEAAMTQLLRSALARSAKDSAAAVPPLTPGTDIARLKRHVSLVFDRLGKGMCLNGQGPSDGGSGGEVV